MLVSDLIFDLLLFGALLLGATLDSSLSALHGAASLLVVGAATYLAAQEIHEALERRGWWTQESLWTSVALSAIGFLYFLQRNQSDLALFGLSLCLMLTSLMATIALLSSLGSMLRDASPRGLVGFVASTLGAVILGGLAGLLALALGRDGASSSLLTKLIPLACALVVWKLRQSVRPPQDNSSLTNVAREDSTPKASAYSGVAPNSENGVGEVAIAPLSHRALIPHRGTLLDRLWPALIIGALLIAARGGMHSPLESSAVANPDQTSEAADASER